MPNSARIGDTISHGGNIVQGSPDTFINGIPSARKGDAVICMIHGPVAIADGSPTVFVNGIPKARIGDPITCGAVITSGSPDTFTGS